MTDCAILAVASTTDTVRALIQRLAKDVRLDDNASTVPWTLANKYYTAEVHFLVHTVASIHDELHAPALLFVWNRGEPYRDLIHKLARHVSRHEFEVVLAVRLPETASTPPTEIEDDQDVDAYLSSKGFEFVDVPDVEASSPDRSGIPGIHRIVDALSTIMWPSMQTSKSITASSFINPGISSDDYHNLVRLVGENISGKGGDRMQRELEELERWLDEDTLSRDADARSAAGDDEAVPWSTVVTPGTLSPSSSGFLETSRPITPKAGFDDDFTSFVSASPPSSASIPQLSTKTAQRLQPLTSTSFSSTFSFNPTSSGPLTPVFDDHGSSDTTHLTLGESYKSLGSVSDFGDQDKDLVSLERLSNSSGQADEDMPSRAEIAETSHRIFGTLPLSFSPTQEQHSGDLRAAAHDGVPSQDHFGQEVDVEMTDADLERFDLQSVLGALQGLKEEIAGMPDKERRKAAARVALGLAYGLGGNPHSEANEEVV